MRVIHNRPGIEINAQLRMRIIHNRKIELSMIYRLFKAIISIHSIIEIQDVPELADQT
jgi:hypothetical protein